MLVIETFNAIQNDSWTKELTCLVKTDTARKWKALLVLLRRMVLELIISIIFSYINIYTYTHTSKYFTFAYNIGRVLVYRLYYQMIEN